MVGNVQTKINFPHDFKYYHTIKIDNKDNKHYVDAVVKINLYNENAGNSNAIEHFFYEHFINNGSTPPSGKNLEHIRIYDEDLTTPIMVCYNSSVVNKDNIYTADEW